MPSAHVDWLGRHTSHHVCETRCREARTVAGDDSHGSSSLVSEHTNGKIRHMGYLPVIQCVMQRLQSASFEWSCWFLWHICAVRCMDHCEHELLILFVTTIGRIVQGRKFCNLNSGILLKIASFVLMCEDSLLASGQHATLCGALSWSGGFRSSNHCFTNRAMRNTVQTHSRKIHTHALVFVFIFFQPFLLLLLYLRFFGFFSLFPTPLLIWGVVVWWLLGRAP